MQKANELIRKKQGPAQSWYGMLEAFMIKFILMIFCWLEAILTDRLCRKSTSREKNPNKSLVQDIGYRNIESWTCYEKSNEFSTCKTTEISKENE